MVTLDPAHLLERFQALRAVPGLQTRLAQTSAEIYLVGGAVRDLILGREPRELDLVVDGDLEPVVLALAGERRQFERFGTARVMLDGFVYDLARSRSESYERPGALPDVTPAELVADLGRRDFTVNAVALGIHGAARGRLLAAERALEDLATGQLRVLHPASFVDDPTRLLRLVRYASRLGFGTEPATLALAEAAIASGALQTVSGNRLGAELRLAAREPDPISALTALHPLGLDAALAPGFGLAKPEAARYALELLPADGDSASLVIAAAAAEMEGAERDRMLARLAFAAPARDVIATAARRGPILADALPAAASASAVAVAVAMAPVEAVALAGGLAGRGSDGAQAARRWLQEWRLVTLEIDGGDLLAAGVKPGPAVGVGLRAALAAKLDGRAQSAGDQLAEALRAALA